MAKQKLPVKPKAERLNADAYLEDHQLIDQIKTEHNFDSRKEAIHFILNHYRGTPNEIKPQECEFRVGDGSFCGKIKDKLEKTTDNRCNACLQAQKIHEAKLEKIREFLREKAKEIDCKNLVLHNEDTELWCCNRGAIAQHKQILNPQECIQCRERLFNLPFKTKIPVCPKNNGLSTKDKCVRCFEEQPQTYAACAAHLYYENRDGNFIPSEPQRENPKIENKPKEPWSLSTDKEIERVREKERIRSEAHKQRLDDKLEADREAANLKRKQRFSYSGQSRVIWADSYYDTFALGDGFGE